MQYATKTELYQKVKKPQLERERRARINKCLDALKHMIAEAQQNENVLRMDKVELLETTIVHLRSRKQQQQQQQRQVATATTMDSFKSGYINAVNEVSRVLASTPGVSVAMGKTVMSHLGHAFNGLHQKYEQQQQKEQQQPANRNYMHSLTIDCAASSASCSSSASSMSSASPALSPASSGYHSDDCEMMNSPKAAVWRPW